MKPEHTALLKKVIRDAVKRSYDKGARELVADVQLTVIQVILGEIMPDRQQLMREINRIGENFMRREVTSCGPDPEDRYLYG